MSVGELLSELRARDIALVVEGDRLKSIGQKGNLTPDLADRIRTHKTELLKVLSSAGDLVEKGRPSDTIERAPNQWVYPLSVTQTRTAVSGRELSGLPTAFALKGPLDVAVLRETLTRIVRRHTTLRTTFDLSATPPVQRVTEEFELSLPLVDLRALAKPEGRLKDTLAKLCQRRFDVAKGPLYVFELIALSDTEHVLFTAFSPIVFDGRSFDVFWNELRLGYAALSKGAPWPFPELSVSYADYVGWQERMLREREPKLAQFWGKRLGEQLPELPLPTDRPRSNTTSTNGGSLTFALPPEVAVGLRSFAAQVSSTPQLVMLAALYALLARLGEAERIVIGSPIEARAHRGAEEQIGTFVNMLLLPMDVDPSLSFESFVRRVRDDALSAYEHQEYPTESLRVRSPRSRSGGVSPAFQVEFSFQQVSQRGSHMGPIALSQVELPSGAATNDWTLWVKDWGERIAGAVEFKTDLFDRETIAHWSACYVEHLAALLQAPKAQLADVELMDGQRAVVEEASRKVVKRLPKWASSLPEARDAALGAAPISAVRVEDERGRPLPLGVFGTLQLVTAAGSRKTDVRARLRADGTLERAEDVTNRAEEAAYVAPVTDLEKKLVRLYEEVLGLPRVGIDDNYFDLGGNSLLALKLFLKIQEVCGIKLPQTTLLDAATPRLLGKAISEAFSRDRDQCLVVLRKGTTDQAMFFVHDGDGETLLYMNLARRLKPEYTVYGIHPRARGVAPIVHTSVEQAAKHYVSEMQRVCPKGPYRVGGLCAGGVIAFAVAAELEARSQTVELLLIGEAAPAYAEKRRSSTTRRMDSASRLAREGLKGDLPRAVRTAARSLFNTGRYELTKLGHRARQTASLLLLERLAKGDGEWPRQMPPPSVRDVWSIAEPKYRPPRLHSTTPVIVRASSGDGSGDDQPLKELLVDSAFEWQPLSDRPIRLLDVAGGRSTMWQEPHVADLARQLDALMP